MTLLEAARDLSLANNGYTLASSMSEEFIRQAERLVKRSSTLDIHPDGKFYKIKMIDAFGKEVDAYLTARAATIYKIV